MHRNFYNYDVAHSHEDAHEHPHDHPHEHPHEHEAEEAEGGAIRVEFRGHYEVISQL